MSDWTASKTRLCDNCGSGNRAAAKFCEFCGAPLNTQESPVEDFYTQLARLQRVMAGAFSLGELRDVAFGLGILDFASLPGETKEEKTREFIWRMVREDRLLQLVIICRRERLSVDWPFAEQALPQPAPGNPLEDLFRRGINHQLRGDLADALQVFEGIRYIDPNFPGLRRQIISVVNELNRRYVDQAGRVNNNQVFHPPASTLARPRDPMTPPPAPTVYASPAPGRRRIRPVVATVVVLLALFLIFLWLVSQ